MAYTNSKLAVKTKISPNRTVGRNHSIDRITPHCVVGQMTADSLCREFANSSKQASCNYAIGTEGAVALIVEEKDRSWCSSSPENDNRAVTIECASDAFHPYAFNSKVYNKLIDLCTDICKRNGKNKLIWFNNKTKALEYKPKANEMILTVHRWFKNKACPGDWLMARMGELANTVTERLEGDDMTEAEVKNIAEKVANDMIYKYSDRVYNKLDDVPAYAKSTVQKLMDKGVIKGTDKGLQLNETLLRMLVINDRAGVYDK